MLVCCADDGGYLAVVGDQYLCGGSRSLLVGRRQSISAVVKLEWTDVGEAKSGWLKQKENRAEVRGRDQERRMSAQRAHTVVRRSEKSTHAER